MSYRKFGRYGFVLVLAFTLSLASVGTATAGTPQSSSTNYSVNDVQIGGAGASLNDCSTSYCAKTSVGDTVAGRASSTNYSAQFGANTTGQPMLEVIVTGGNQNVGVLGTSTTATATEVIKIRNYLSHGYTLYIAGAAPSQGQHTLQTMDTSCPCTSQPGAEQFGINLVANTSPSVGANPVQVPSSTYSFGTVNTDYNQSNLFKYHDGAAVAGSTKSTGETDYTMSMIINISNATPGGQYTGALSAVVVPVF